jgi:hypothetical protein
VGFVEVAVPGEYARAGLAVVAINPAVSAAALTRYFQLRRINFPPLTGVGWPTVFHDASFSVVNAHDLKHVH